MTNIAAFDAEEHADISVFLESLTPQQWETRSLCDQWRIRDVVGHLLIPYEIGTIRLLRSIAHAGFSTDRALSALAMSRASGVSTTDLIAAWKTARRQVGRLAATAPRRGFFYDHFVHHQDMRRPLGLARDIPTARLLALLECAPRFNTFGTRQRARGLRLVTTDVDWSHGDGPLVTGRAEALLVALAGRPAPLAELQGDGLAILSSRINLSGT